MESAWHKAVSLFFGATANEDTVFVFILFFGRQTEVSRDKRYRSLPFLRLLLLLAVPSVYIPTFYIFGLIKNINSGVSHQYKLVPGHHVVALFRHSRPVDGFFPNRSPVAVGSPVGR